MSIVVTYCSKKKARPDILHLAALQRYAGSHVTRVHQYALLLNKPLYFLSGLYGLIHQDYAVAHYDYQLKEAGVRLVELVTRQLRCADVRELTYITERNENTQPYDATILRACDSEHADITVVTYDLSALPDFVNDLPHSSNH